MALLIAIVAGILPMTIYPIFLYLFDRYEREPLYLVFGVFLWGFIPAAILSLISQLILGVPFLILDETGLLADQVGTILLAPVTEEIFKGLAILIVYLIWRNEFDGVLDGIVYGGLVGFGFAAIENVLYFLETDFAVIFLRTVVFGLNHAFFTSLTGIGFGVARHARKWPIRLAAPLLGLVGAMVAHMLHNTTVTFVEQQPLLICLAFLADWGGVLFVILLILFATRRERKWLIEHLRDEVGQTLNSNQYEVVTNPIRRFSSQLGVLFSKGPGTYFRLMRYFHILTELAYKKFARRRRGDKGAPAVSVEMLRGQAAELSAEFAHLF
nr:PrsW family intramembrane metalloprotease [Anaerolineae bacterium]